MGGVIESQRKYCVQHPITSRVHCNNLTNPSLVTEQVRYFGYIKRACVLGVIQKCRHTWRGGGGGLLVTVTYIAIR